MSKYAPREWAPDEKPMLPGSPSTPAHPTPLRFAYLFVGILIANLQLRHDELSSAHAEMHTLSGLLPICAWCKKVRDDDGYWQQVEDYFACRSQITFTHGVCAECLEDQKEESKQLKKH